MTDATFCIWRRYVDGSRSRGPIEFPDGEDPDGPAYLFAILDGNPGTYCQFAEDYFESTIPIDAVRHVNDHLPLTDRLVASLNANAKINGLVEDLTEIGYATAKTT